MIASEMRAAVCGAGFIGQNLIERLTEAGMVVNVLDHKPSPPAFRGGGTWIQGEFADPSHLSAALIGADVAYHLVSSTVPGDENVDPIAELSENIFSTIRFLDACIRHTVRRVVFVSSSSVYGLQSDIPISEDAQTDPISSHGIQKLTIEKYLMLYRFHHDLDVRIVRLANPFGPGQRLYGRQGFVAMAIGHVLRAKPILLRDGGRPVRDFIYIDDVSRALVAVALAEDAPTIMNLGSGVGHSLRDVIKLLEDVLGRSVPTTSGELRRSEIPVSVLDVSRAADVLGFGSTMPLRDGLALTLRHHGLAPGRV